MSPELSETLNVGYMIAAILAAIGVPGVIVWVVKRVNRAADADSDVRTAATITASLAPVTLQISNLSGQTTAMNERLVRIEAQFGPNGGGMREAVNRISNDLATLNGAFTQHVSDSRN